MITRTVKRKMETVPEEEPTLLQVLDTEWMINAMNDDYAGLCLHSKNCTGVVTPHLAALYMKWDLDETCNTNRYEGKHLAEYSLF